MWRKDGFSLIELMVVIAIVALLTAVAIPAYKSYSIKAKISTPITIVDKIARDALSEYQLKGTFPSSLTVNGVTIPNVSWANVSLGTIKGLAYEGSSSGIMINFSLTGLDGIPNYITPTDAAIIPSGGRSIMAYSIKDMGNGVLKAVCGQYSPSTVNDAIPATYLPANCTCYDIYTFYNFSTGC